MIALVRISLLAAVSALGFSVHALEGNFQASILVYDQPAGPPRLAYSVPAGQNLSYYTSRELADDVILSGGPRAIAGVNFEYYSNYAETAGLTFRMYERDAAGLPGTLIYSTPLDILDGGGLVNIAFSYDATNILPQQFFYSVQFSGVENGKIAGMIIPDQAATTGFSSPQVWQKQGDNWFPLELNATQGRQLGLIRDGDTLILLIVDTPLTVVTVESSDNLASGWLQVAQVETDENGEAEYEEEIGSDTQVYFRTQTP